MYLNRVYLENLAERRYRVVFEYLNYIMAFDIDDDNAWPVRLGKMRISPRCEIIAA